MKALSIWASVLVAVAVTPLGAESARLPFEEPGLSHPQGKIDELVFARLAQAGVKPARLCSDGVFVRRVYLDLIGTLPTADEARQFLADKDPQKRARLIDRLLEREEYADYWALKWGDLLRVKAEFPINLWPNAAQAYHRWIRTSLKENTPYDRFARSLLTANGSNFRVPEVNFYRAVQSREPESIAQAVVLAFLGERAEKWPKARLAATAAFFSQISYKQTAEWKEEIVIHDPARPAPGEAVLPDGTKVRLDGSRDPRQVFAEWLLVPGNPAFARSIVNRIWFWLLGRGIIHEPDDIRPDNPPSHPELLAYLQRELVDAKYDLKHVFRLILNSATYQSSSLSAGTRNDKAALFANYPLRRLEAEVLVDALNQVTGTGEKYSSAIPEPFTFVPESQRSIALADGSITSSFLELFGRSPRDSGLEAERNNRLTAGQRLHLLNSSHVRKKIEEGPRLRALAASSKRPREVVDNIYLTILSRLPTEEEQKAVANYAEAAGLKPRDAAVDLAWALVNSAEFVFRH